MAQAPPEQTAVACISAQIIPQVPQLRASVANVASHPFIALPSQLPKPAVQAIWQAPPAQEATPFAVEQALPQPPQLRTSAAVLVSQPVEAIVSQSVNPALQAAMAQTPMRHWALACGRVQTLVHEPQLVTVTLVFVSQPFETSPSQLAKPGLQAMPQTPAWQLAVPLTLEQACPQLPQWSGSAAVWISQPLRALLSQSAKPGLHEAIAHSPWAHTALALARLHGWPQPLQFCGSVASAASQPFDGSLSQLPKPEAQTIWQAPETQEAVPLVLAHTVVQAPQWFTSKLRLASQPSVGSELQSAKPVSH
jgi:hypothetical protein